MTLWQRRDEWTRYANCFGSVDHTVPPERHTALDPLDDESGLPVADPVVVRRICDSCRVRPECVQWATDPAKPERGVWVAGKWIPENKRKARKVRAEPVLTIPRELESRGDDV